MTGPVADAWRARVIAADGGIHGAGVLIDPWHVLTCAHVVARALGVDSGGARPTETVTVDFPSFAGATRLAVVPPGGWIPRAPDSRGDLAVLFLDQPAPGEAGAATLDRCGDLDGRPVRTYGHPPHQDDGVWARARLIGAGGPGGEWVQMDGLTSTGRRVEQGFSGAGVLDEESSAVIGLVVAEDLESANRVAWMLPMERITAYLPMVRVSPVGTATGAGRDARAPGPRAESVVERRLSQPERRELVERLVAVPGMLNRQTRDLYLQAVQQEIGERILFGRQEDARLDIWAFSMALLARPGATRAVTRVLVEMHPTSGEVVLLDEFVERLFPDLLLEPVERFELEGLLAGVGGPWIAAAYRAAAPRFSDSPVSVGHDLLAAIRHLEGFGRLRGGPPAPLLVFVDDLAHRIGGPTAIKLHRWIDAVADRLRVDRAAVRALCDETERRGAQGNEVFMVVQLQPDAVDAERFLLSAWLQESSRTERLLLRDDVPRTLREVAEQVDDLLPGIPEQVAGDIDELTVEFILPRRLIGHPVDEWEFDRGSFPRPLGIRYPVVVRSLERLGDRLVRDDWQRKWRSVLDEGHRAGALPIVAIDPDRPRDPRALYSELIADHRLVCLAIPFPPQEAGDQPGGDDFAAGLKAGIPVIVWSRQPVDAERFSRLVRDTLALQGIRNLPRQVRWLRGSAVTTTDSAQSAHFAPQVGLLWDDADRVPAPFRRSIRLQAPPLGDR